MTPSEISPTIAQNICKTIVFRLLQKISVGQLTIWLPDGQEIHFGDRDSSLSADMTISDYRFFSDVILRGEVGLGESFMQGMWNTGDIAGLFRLFIRNRHSLKEGYPVAAWFISWTIRLLDKARKNTRIGSRKNIEQHYDLSNEFFQKFLDPSMLYSCGIYASENDTCEAAQKNKINSIIQKAQIKATDHVLEIGCGWCGFAVEAVKQTQCRLTGITVSQAQYELALNRIKSEGLEKNIKICLQDYREIEGLYDKIVSIEMLEAVGHRYFGKFFQCCDRLLKPGGLLVIQVITIPDQRYKEYRRERDWIQKYIFPGGLLPSVTILSEAATRYSSFIMENLNDIGTNYAVTLKDWRRKFLSNIESVSAMGFNKVFQRKWEYYLSICEAGFAERVLGDIQVVFRKPA
ncbi:MAG: class I SAM-dependent methyltransferase [Syntrophaceae bacterium]|nr:class I SAM-dependent methyltransferase [Syntrophaceae bacterium]